MTRIQKVIMWIMTLLLSASQVCAATFEGHHLATGIDVVYRQDNRQILCSYQQTNNMEEILNYLRLLEYAGMPHEDPEQQSGNSYRLTVHLADGRQHIYHLHADRYLSRDFRPWIKVESAGSFEDLLSSLPKK